MPVSITHYEAYFEPKSNKFIVRVKIGASPPALVPVDTIPEFNAMILLLGKQGVMYDPVSHSISLPPRPTGT